MTPQAISRVLNKRYRRAEVIGRYGLLSDGFVVSGRAGKIRVEHSRRDAELLRDYRDTLRSRGFEVELVSMGGGYEHLIVAEPEEAER